jgi:hypothetical protein
MKAIPCIEKARTTYSKIRRRISEDLNPQKQCCDQHISRRILFDIFQLLVFLYGVHPATTTIGPYTVCILRPQQ